MNKLKAAFFDRDGTLIEDANYLDSFDKIKVIPDSMHLAKYLQDSGYKLFVVTNQSGVARGYFDENFVNNTHEYLQDIFFKYGVIIKKYYFCPHHPDLNCDCRKPNPGLIFKAQAEFNIDLTKSLMFGDKMLDINTGQAAGCKSFFIQDFFNIPEKDKLKFYENIFKNIEK